jgi:hypothetical protein
VLASPLDHGDMTRRVALMLSPLVDAIQVVRGSPKRVLDVLMHGTTNTTILGPARTMEVLECTKVDDNTTKEVG